MNETQKEIVDNYTQSVRLVNSGLRNRNGSYLKDIVTHERKDRSVDISAEYGIQEGEDGDWTKSELVNIKKDGTWSWTVYSTKLETAYGNGPIWHPKREVVPDD